MDMNCVCQNLYNRIQNSLREMITTLAYNRINNEQPSTDDGSYSPNLNLLNRNNNNNYFDSNLFFNIFFFLLALVTLSSLISFRRRRRLGGNNSSFN